MRSKEAMVIIAHGSREAESNQAFLQLVDKFRTFYPEKHVQAAFLELAKPLIHEAIELCVSKGAEEITVMPLMFFQGKHVKTDIPAIIEKAKASHPQVDFHYTKPLAEYPGLLEAMKEQASETPARRK